MPPRCWLARSVFSPKPARTSAWTVTQMALMPRLAALRIDPPLNRRRPSVPRSATHLPCALLPAPPTCQPGTHSHCCMHAASHYKSSGRDFGIDPPMAMSRAARQKRGQIRWRWRMRRRQARRRWRPGWRRRAAQPAQQARTRVTRQTQRRHWCQHQRQLRCVDDKHATTRQRVCAPSLDVTQWGVVCRRRTAASQASTRGLRSSQ